MGELGPDSSAAEVQRVKNKFKQDARFANKRMLGDVEFYLISHAMDGDLCFLFISPAMDGFVGLRGGVKAKSSLCAADNAYEAVPLTRREVALHWCSYGGQRHTVASLPRRVLCWPHLHLMCRTSHRRSGSRMPLDASVSHCRQAMHMSRRPECSSS